MRTLLRLGLCLATLLINTIVWANLPYFPIQFPRDEAAHFENVPYSLNTLSEWWYYNGTLTSKTGRKLGYYLSYIYVYDAHTHMTVPVLQIQVTDIDKQKVYGKQLFMLPKLSTISSTQLSIHYGKTFSLQKYGQTYVLNARLNSEQGETLSLSLRFTPNPLLDPMLINDKGMIDMWPGTNSYYYSIPELVTEGYVQIGSEVFELDANRSLSWMDHQWGDFVLIRGKNQWMWTSIQLQNGLDANVFVFVDDKTKQPLYAYVTILKPDHSLLSFTDLKRFSYTAHEVPQGEKHPHTYDLTIPELELDIHLNALAPGQDVNGIWEGVSKAEGSYQGKPISGQAYTESRVGVK